MLFISAFVTGLLGSMHCAGMCGPIAIATPVVGNTLVEKLLSKLLYNLGRVTTYCILGLLLGAFGFGLKLAGMQQLVSIAAGLFIILATIGNNQFFAKLTNGKLGQLRNAATAKLLGIKTYKALFGIGLLNGLLPCGFVYIALVGAVATQYVWQGALFMLLFGLGTMPVMIGVSLTGQFIKGIWRIKLQRITPVVAVVIGCLFILRGLSLGIPFISPNVTTEKSIVKDCCKPSRNSYNPIMR